MPVMQKLNTSLQSLLTNVRTAAGLGGQSGSPRQAPVAAVGLFSRTDPAVDGDECTRDCDSCSTRYPTGFKINGDDRLYGNVKAWSVHVLVATGKTDWKRDVGDERGSVMEAIERQGGKAADGGRVMLSASNMAVPGVGGGGDYARPTEVLVLPAFTIVGNMTPEAVSRFMRDVVATAPTTSSPLAPQPRFGLAMMTGAAAGSEEGVSGERKEGDYLIQRPCPHGAVILLCSQRTRDVRCGQSAPILRREFERHLRLLGLQRDADDDRPGGVGIYFVSHVGGHKYSANVIIYRRPNAFGNDSGGTGGISGTISDPTADVDVGAAQCIWLARVAPEDCENIVRYTVLRGKVVKPERQLRGGFDRTRGLMSW